MNLQELINKAESGDAVAQNDLAICYEYGKGTKINLSEAIKWYKKAAEQGNVDAQFNLALCIEFGRGTEINLCEAIKWYKKAAEQGDVDAQYNLAICYEEGRGTEANLQKAIKWYQKAAEQDYYAMNNLAVCYEEVSNFKEAFKLYETSAKQGHVEAQFNLALCYEEGKGTDIDLKEAIKWYEKAAEQGYTEAQFNLCLLYFNKDDIESIIKGLDWLVKAAKKGMEEAGSLLRDFIAEIIKLAELGDAEAQFLLGRSFQNGDGVIMNQDEAFKWYKLSAEQDYDKALNNLACIYLECENYKEAKECFERAAKQDCALAQFNLGAMYNDGDTIERDISRAIYWLAKAAEHGIKAANEILDEIHEEQKS